MRENCSMRSIELCVREVIAGNRLLHSEPALAGPQAPRFGRPEPGASALITDGWSLPRQSRGPYRAATGYSISAVGAPVSTGEK